MPSLDIINFCSNCYCAKTFIGWTYVVRTISNPLLWSIKNISVFGPLLPHTEVPMTVSACSRCQKLSECFGVLGEPPDGIQDFGR